MMVFVYYAAAQYQASRRVAAEVQRIRAANLPIDAETQNQWFTANTSREHSDAWAEILMLGNVSASGPEVMEKLPYLGNAALPPSIDPDQPWPDEPVVAQWLEMTKPLIDKIHSVTRSKQPTWQPLAFEGVVTLLEPVQHSRNIGRILQLEIEHALYVGDGDRAMRGLQSLDGLAYAFDWNVCLVTDLVGIALRGIHFKMIQRSLSLDIWTDVQLAELSSQLAPRVDLAKRWRATIAGERGFMFDEIANQGARVNESDLGSFSLIFSIPSVQESLLAAYSQMETVADQGFEKLETNAQELESRLADVRRSGFSIENIGVRMLLPAVNAFATAVIRSEDTRRFTLTAVGIKRYQKGQGKFPDRLEQLKNIGFGATDWTTVGGKPFGYSNSESVQLWSYSFRDMNVIEQAPPKSDDDNMQQIVTIR